MGNKKNKTIRRIMKKEQTKTADKLIIQLFNSPFKYRFKFAMKLLRGKL